MNRDVKCFWCGKRIYWIHVGDRKMPIDAGFTPYKRDPEGRHRNNLYTNEGGEIPCEILPESRREEADGFAHCVHICQKKPTYHRPRPMSRRKYYD